MFKESSHIIAGISTKVDGNMKLDSSSVSDPAAYNRQLFFNRRGFNDRPIISAGLVHGRRVAVIQATDPGGTVPGYDALITDRKGVMLTITVADCLPLYFYDPVKSVIAIAHAGWRGILDNIGGEVAASFKKNYGSQLSNIQVVIGPHLQKCHFEVQDDVASRFAANQEFIIKTDRTFIDLSGLVRRQLVSAGLADNNIRVSGECTYCLTDKYFSYRRDKGELKTMISYICLPGKE